MTTQSYKVTVESAKLTSYFQKFDTWAKAQSQTTEVQQLTGSFAKNIQDAGFRIQANSGKIAGPAVKNAGLFVKYIFPASTCNADTYFTCLSAQVKG